MEYFTAIIFFKRELNKDPYKYRNIKNIENFKQFVSKNYKDAIYFNLYNKGTRDFHGRVWIK